MLVDAATDQAAVQAGHRRDRETVLVEARKRRRLVIRPRAVLTYELRAESVAEHQELALVVELVGRADSGAQIGDRRS